MLPSTTCVSASQRVQGKKCAFNWFDLTCAFLAWIVTKHETVADQVLLDRSNGASNSRILRGHKT
jgi:hypothetical protein